MAGAIVARTKGDDYQARWFWIQACRLFKPNTKVIRVIYEHNAAKAFDDVVVMYDQGMIDLDGNVLCAEYYQVKFHQTAYGSLTWDNLLDPTFINASSVSLLQRLHAAQSQHAPNGSGCKFYLLSPWKPHPDDLLARVVSETDGRIDWHRLADGGPRSDYGKLRAKLRAHLGIASDTELHTIIQPLRLWQGPNLQQLQDYLNAQLQLAGFSPVDDDKLINPYDELTRKLLQNGRTVLDRYTAEQVARSEGLWLGQTPIEPSAYRVGLRSFLRHAEQIEDETDQHICLLSHFNGRHVKSSELWQTAIYSSLEQFCIKALKGRGRCHIYLHTHTSIAYAAGYCLDSKSGIDVVPMQSTREGRKLWRPNLDALIDRLPSWAIDEISVSNEGKDIAIAINVAHLITPDVEMYVGQSLSTIRRIISFSLPGEPSNSAIANGTHAKRLADAVSTYLKQNRTNSERQGLLHLFIAAPNGFTFFLGQLGRSFGPCVLYEYNLEANQPGDYTESLRFPVN